MFESTAKSPSSVFDDHSYCWQDTPKSLDYIDKRNFIEVLVNEINEMPLKNK